MTHIEEDTSKTYCNEKKSALQQRMKQRERQICDAFFCCICVVLRRIDRYTKTTCGFNGQIVVGLIGHNAEETIHTTRRTP